MNKKIQSGFTLIEVMIVVAIIGILATIAYPSYRDYILRGRLVDATNGMASMRADMERHFQDNRSYDTVGAFTSPCLNPDVDARTFGDNFIVSCTVTTTPPGYVLTATGLGFEFTVDERDLRATTATPPGSGWPTCTTRWMLKKGQAC